MKHVIVEVPAVESGKAHAYRLRGTTAGVRAAEATNGVPKLQPPYPDGQLCSLCRVTRAQVKEAREHNKGAGKRDILRDRQLTDLIDRLAHLAHALNKPLYSDNGQITLSNFDIIDVLDALDDAADELLKLRG